MSKTKILKLLAIHLITICSPLLDITQVPVKFLLLKSKYLTPQWKSDCCMHQKFKRPGQPGLAMRCMSNQFWMYINLNCNKNGQVSIGKKLLILMVLIIVFLTNDGKAPPFLFISNSCSAYPLLSLLIKWLVLFILVQWTANQLKNKNN